MPECIILVGPPGSGKSTLAQEYVSKGYNRISQDDQGKAHLDIFKHDAFIGENIIVDRMNFSKEQRKRYIDILKEAQVKNFGNEYKIKIIVLHENKETCLARCGSRENHPTIKDERSAQSALNTFFSKYERPTPDEGELEFRYPEGEKNWIIVTDMDNTLSDATHREHLLDKSKGKPNWKAFFDAMDKDPVNEWCRIIIDDTLPVVIVSARPDDYRKKTEDWLFENNIDYKELYMRARNDFRKDDIIKEIILDFELKTRYNILFWLDDRKQVIDKIRSRGITVLDCAGEKGHF